MAPFFALFSFGSIFLLLLLLVFFANRFVLCILRSFLWTFLFAKWWSWVFLRFRCTFFIALILWIVLKLLYVASVWVYFIICIDGSLVRVINVIRLILKGHIALNNKNSIFVSFVNLVPFMAKLWDNFMEKVRNLIMRISSQFIFMGQRAA